MYMSPPAVLAVLLLLANPALAGERSQAVKFAAGASSATITGTIKGDDSVAYMLGARAGQQMSAELTARNPSCYMNITAPGANEAVHIGSSAGNTFSGPVTVAGDQKIQVYLMRNAARRNETCAYTIKFAITG